MRISDWSSDVCSSDLTGRAGATGTAYTFVTPEDAENVANIEKLTGQTNGRLEGKATAPRESAPEPVSEPAAAEKPARRGRGRDRGREKERADRKSTRLNSSH